MDKTDAFQFAIKLLDERFGLGKDEAHHLIRTSNEANAIYRCALSLIEDIVLAASPFAEAANHIEKQYGKDLPNHQIQFAELTMGQFQRIRRVLSVEEQNLQPPTPEQLLVTLTTTPTWMKPHQRQAAHELKKKGFIHLNFASGEDPPCHARLTLAGIGEKANLLKLKESGNVSPS